jgi:hypothetical protein
MTASHPYHTVITKLMKIVKTLGEGETIFKYFIDLIYNGIIT